jgi:hypothetical protein
LGYVEPLAGLGVRSKFLLEAFYLYKVFPHHGQQPLDRNTSVARKCQGFAGMNILPILKPYQPAGIRLVHDV